MRIHLRRIERVSLRHAHKFIVRRFANLREVRRHTVGWLLLVGVLSGISYWQGGLSAQQYSANMPAKGGTYTEGVEGALDNLNPIFASTPAERSASRLLFASLLVYDENNDMVGELAQDWTVDSTASVYTVRLRDTAKWQDGVPITAEDVLFTFNLIKDADTRSPLYAGWRNVSIEKLDDKTVKFTLPVGYVAFLNYLTVGILPHHILKDTAPVEMRTSPYNHEPTVASGQFKYDSITVVDAKQSHYLLNATANKSYVLGAPKLATFQLHAYKDVESMPQAFTTQEVASVSGLSLPQFGLLGDDKNYIRKDAPLYNGVYAFLKTDAPFLADINVRRALQYATNQPAVLELLGGKAQELRGPLLPGQVGYRTDVGQPVMDVEYAKKLLDGAGWVVGANGKRSKAGEPLKLRVVTVNNGNYPAVAEAVMKQWSQIGVEFDSLVVKPEEVQQSVIVSRSYDVLIYEVAIGRDPDVYAYWHSSQANAQGLNLSDYKSARADDMLGSARGKLDFALREAKYRQFVQQWLNDIPAIALYRPMLTYVQNRNVTSFTERPLVDATDRYYNVGDWAASHAQLRLTQ